MQKTQHSGQRRDGSGAPRDVGHLYGFGNTLERYLLLVKGCKQRGGPASGPYDHATGKGRVLAAKGDYNDALVNKRSSVVLNLVDTVEALGGLSLPTWSGASLEGGTAHTGPWRSRWHLLWPPAHQHQELRLAPCATHVPCCGVQ